MAIPRVLVTNAAVGAASMDQPTTRREYVSSTTAQYTLPSRVGCSVISGTHNWSGSARELTTDPICGGGMWRRLPVARTAGEALDTGRAHQLLDRLVSDADALPEDQLRPHAACAVGAP